MILPDMVGIVVADMKASLAFYRMLDLPIPDGVENEPYVEATSANGYRISWNSLEMVKGLDPEYAAPAGYRMELAFKCETAAEVDVTFRRLTSAGYTGHREPWDAFWGQRYAIVDDPDGNHISLFAALE